ncbi:hydantoinase/oxoprolinase family protein [Eubacterium barkeri]|uniref:N-methylhydantoinase A n=1 Tax=Eubacterium barkeri TaxID=1528 RepID=A0A1H3HQ51_EUBBA|nr:hydantoinase/oxoprolinase family protein [Eubacterium barkeri]SDY16799.1 N-methylhydantoinase A [Eubacterium barkeri]
MRIATDIGGTFTDLVVLDGERGVFFEKSHTTPPRFEKGVIDVIKKSGISTAEIELFFHGTTTVINALTERKGAKTGLITTKGFRDVLEIARCNRPDLFNLVFAKPRPFIPRHLRCEVEERMSYKGEVMTPLVEDDIDGAVAYLREQGVESIAVCMLHAYANDAHEQRTVARIHELWPEVFVTASRDVTLEWREYERTSTIALNAYVMPTASSYVDRLEGELKALGVDCPKYIMKSNGGTTTFEQSKISPINMVESGPVAGVFGAAVVGDAVGEPNIIAFDIGGTTAKCSLIDKGQLKVSTEYRIERTESYAGYPVMAPVVDIVEIGNGGGSIAWIDDAGSLKVGPQSAGAMPGPVAYGNGSSNPTTTDACLLTGRLSPDNFDNQVDMAAVETAILDKVGTPLGMTALEAAMSIIRVADANMLNALKLISVRRGYDPRDFAMVAFGGGGPMHSAYLAKELGVRRVIIPSAASVFSAWGMLMADQRNDYIQTKISRMKDTPVETLNSWWQPLIEEAKAGLMAQGVTRENILLKFVADMRYLGQEHTVSVDAPPVPWSEADKAALVEQFHETHEHFYTFKLEGTPTEIVNLHLVAYGRQEKLELPQIAKQQGDVAQARKSERDIYFEDSGFIQAAVYDRLALGAGARISGPAVVEEPTASTVVGPDQQVTVDIYGNLMIEMKEDKHD